MSPYKRKANMRVTKRDGRIVPFDEDKIRQAVLKAFVEVDGDESPESNRKASDIAKAIKEIDKDMSVEEIQDLVEDKLMASKRKDVAKTFILYRDKRSRDRERNSQFMKTIGEKLTASNVQNQNANVDEHSFGGRRGEADSELMRKYALDYLLSDLAKERHLNNEIYEHDLDSYAVGMHNCLTVPFDKLLANGFNTRQTDVRPAQSINTAFQLVAVIFQIQSLQEFGGVSASHLDWSMVPYVRKSFWKHYKDGLKYIAWSSDYPDNWVPEDHRIDDEYYKNNENVYAYALDLTTKEANQAAQGMFHNLNTLQSRSGNQLPFSSINFGTCTLPEGRMIIKALLEASLEGVGKLHKTPIFPCSIFQCAKGINRESGDPNYDLFRLALKSTARRLYPNYANIDWSGNEGYDKNDPRTYFATMGLLITSPYKIS